MIHHNLYRARLALLGAVLSVVALVALEFPLSMLIHQRNEIALVGSELANVNSRNALLTSDIHALSSKTTIAEIAHEEYGLVDPGQLSFVILPAAGSKSANTLGAATIPPRDLVATNDGLISTPKAALPSGPGLWGRFVARLEFWR